MYNIFFLAKFFEKPEYASDFVRGRIFAKPLKYFTDIEADNTPGRSDPYEGMLAWMQPDQVRLVLRGIDVTGLAAPLEVRTNWANYLNVFCMHAGHSEALDVPSPAGLSVEQIQRELLVPDACRSFGEDAVAILNAREFIRRVEAALPDGVKMYRSLVEYYDPDTFSGHFFGAQPAFRKQKKYRDQREYRLAFESPSEVSAPLIFEVGDLSDITAQMKFGDLNSSLKVAFREAPET